MRASKYADFDRVMLGAVARGKNRLSMIFRDAEVVEAGKRHDAKGGIERLCDYRLQTLKAQGRLTFTRKNGWAVLT